MIEATSKERAQLERALGPLLAEDGWLAEKVKALREKVGIPIEGVNVPPQEADKWFWEFVGRCQREFLGQPPEKNPIVILQEGVKRIMEDSHLTDQVWFEFFLGHVIGWFKTIDDMPEIPLSSAPIWTLRVGPAGEVETVIQPGPKPTVRGMSRLLRASKELDAIWRAGAPSARELDDAQIYERVETRDDCYYRAQDEPWKPISKMDAFKAIANERLLARFSKFGETSYDVEEEKREIYRVRNAYYREKKRRKA